MSIVTKTGDGGTTGLMYGRRVPKNHPRIRACGGGDDMHAAVGSARAAPSQPSFTELLLPLQQELVGRMGELATLDEDMPRYIKDGYAVISAESVARLDQLAQKSEREIPPIKD